MIIAVKYIFNLEKIYIYIFIIYIQVYVYKLYDKDYININVFLGNVNQIVNILHKSLYSIIIKVYTFIICDINYSILYFNR